MYIDDTISEKLTMGLNETLMRHLCFVERLYRSDLGRLRRLLKQQLVC